ncbi:hypothetical protein BX070DRAFT_231044 [Coemansia spiralis]|nr:hypothetical protein BX070DRAFT_231044 [Coemansia spiralis]
MDSFVKSVKSQTFQLNGLDNLLAFYSIQNYFWYENTNQAVAKVFLSSDILEASFYKTLEEFPVLAGYLKADSNSRTYIDVDKDNLNMPEFKITQCDIHFQTLKDAKFDMTLFPGLFSDVYTVPSPPGMFGGSIKMALFHIYRFKDNSGIGIFSGIAHVVFDGYGYYSFIKRWAEISVWMHDNTDSKKRNALSSHSFVHDRGVLMANKSNEIDALDKGTYNAVASGGFLFKFLAWLLPNVREKIFGSSQPMSQVTSCYFHIPTQLIESLRMSVQEAAPANAQCYSTNDVLVALITIVIAQCTPMSDLDPQSKYASTISKVFYKPPVKSAEIMALIAVNMRPRLKHLADITYTGNAIINREIVTPLELLQMDPTPKVLATIASSTRQAVINTNEQFASQYIGIINKKPDSYMPLVRPPAHASPGLVFILPAHPDIGGYELSFNVTDGVAKKLVQNKFWMSFVDSYVSTA